jgi:hypothetical protein
MLLWSWSWPIKRGRDKQAALAQTARFRPVAKQAFAALDIKCSNKADHAAFGAALIGHPIVHFDQFMGLNISCVPCVTLGRRRKNSLEQVQFL